MLWHRWVGRREERRLLLGRVVWVAQLLRRWVSAAGVELDRARAGPCVDPAPRSSNRRAVTSSRLSMEASDWLYASTDLPDDAPDATKWVAKVATRWCSSRPSTAICSACSVTWRSLQPSATPRRSPIRVVGVTSRTLPGPGLLEQLRASLEGGGQIGVARQEQHHEVDGTHRRPRRRCAETTQRRDETPPGRGPPRVLARRPCRRSPRPGGTHRVEPWRRCHHPVVGQPHDHVRAAGGAPGPMVVCSAKSACGIIPDGLEGPPQLDLAPQATVRVVAAAPMPGCRPRPGPRRSAP